jgi:DNA-binding NarL/FixJ family response regulator
MSNGIQSTGSYAVKSGVAEMCAVEIESRAGDLFDFILEADRLISSVDQEHELYELLYVLSSKLGKMDAFYVCLYDEDEETVFFPYNWDGDLFDRSDIKGLGNGPTSWVIRNRKMFMLDDTNAHIQHGGENFGDMSRQSRSAIHAPLRATGLDEQEHILGVLSMQSYEPNAYDMYTASVFEWLANRASRVLQHSRDIKEYQDLKKLAESYPKRQTSVLVEQANKFTTTLQEITKLAANLKSLIINRRVRTDLRQMIKDLYKACQRAQSEVVRLTFDLKNPPSLDSRASTVSTDDPFPKLTRRQREVLYLITLSLSYQEIAEELNISVDTVNTHIDAIYNRLGVSGLLKVSQLAFPFRNAYKVPLKGDKKS